MQAWDAVCSQCGLCCFEKDWVRKRVYINLEKPCPYLNTKTGLCDAYLYRFEMGVGCQKMTMLHALFSDYLPHQCQYVRKFRIWKKLLQPPGVTGRVPEYLKQKEWFVDLYKR